LGNLKDFGDLGDLGKEGRNSVYPSGVIIFPSGTNWSFESIRVHMDDGGHNDDAPVTSTYSRRAQTDLLVKSGTLLYYTLVIPLELLQVFYGFSFF
jgi:hypothetical protein